MGGIQQMMLASSAAAGSSTYLDSLGTNPVAAWGLEKLISGYSGFCCKVRNSTTGVETDIPFSGSTVDVSALLTAAAGSSLSVKTLYDQTGNGFHFTQATVAQQPAIVTAGSYNGKLAFGTSAMVATAVTMGTPYVGVYQKMKMPTGSGIFIILEQTTNYNSNAQSFVMYRDSTTARPYNVSMRNTTGGSDYRAQVFDSTTASMQQFTTLLNRTITGTGEQLVWENGSAQPATAVGGTAEQTGNFSTYDLYLGARAGSTFFANIDLYSMAIYNADTSGIRASIEAVIA